MNEEVSRETVSFAIRTGKVTIRALIKGCRAAVRLYKRLRARKQNKQINNPYKRGKQTVKQLLDQGQGATSMEIADEGVKEFLRIARKYGVDYAIVKDKEGDPPKYTIFFKAKDVDVITAILKEYAAKEQKKKDHGERPSVLEKLKQFKEKMANSPHREREKRREPER